MDPAITQAVIIMAAELLMCPIIVFIMKRAIGTGLDEMEKRRGRETEQKKNEREMRENDHQLTVAIARSQLIDNYDRCVEKGYYTVDEREVYHELYNAYKKCGGNGILDTLKIKLERMPTEPPTPEK